MSYKSISFNLTIKSDIVSFNDNMGTGGEIGYSHAVLFGYCTTSNQARLMVVLPILSATPAYNFWWRITDSNRCLRRARAVLKPAQLIPQTETAIFITASFLLLHLPLSSGRQDCNVTAVRFVSEIALQFPFHS